MTTMTPPERHVRMQGPWVEVDLNALSDNIQAAQTVLGSNTELMFVVKSNAYGHGAVPVCCKAAERGVNWFAVAYVREAMEIRSALPQVNILVMGVVGVLDVPDLLEGRITPVVVSLEHGRELACEAERLKGRLSVHIKIDSGMGRLGVIWDEAQDVIETLRREPGLDIVGLCSHFAAVEPSRPEMAGEQVERLKSIEPFQDGNCFRHLSSSRALVYCSDLDYEGVRTGIAMYGYGADEDDMRFKTRPVLRWKSHVIQVKRVPADYPIGYYGAYRTTGPTDIAVISVGYADGYHRLLSNRGDVLIRGHRRHVVGRVSMNWITVDAGLDSGIQPGDEVVLVGEQGRESIWADELARLCHTIPYEILTSIDSQYERRYIDA